MIYRPAAPRQLWDSWLFPWEGKYHLFHLETRESKFDHIGRAVSDDLVHWQPLPSIPIKGRADEWNHYGALTGTVVHHAGKFHLLVGSIPLDQEVVGVFVSDDLEHWREDADNPVLRPAAPYLARRSQAPYWPVDWRDPQVLWSDRDQHYHAVLCARGPQFSADDTGAVLAHVRSKDLRRWEHLPPLASLGKFFHTEVPDWFEFNGRWYVTFNTLSLGGIQIHTATRESLTGAFYLVADRFDDPYRLPDDPFLLGAGCGRQSPYSARTVKHPDGRVVYSHLNGVRPAWGTPKLLRGDEDGRLWLEYFPRVQTLETAVLPIGNAGGQTESLGPWKPFENGVHGAAGVIGAAFRLADDVADAHLCCRITAEPSTARAGIVLRGDAATCGIMVLLDFERQRMQIGCATGRDIIKNSIGPFASWNFRAFDACRRTLRHDRAYLLRCLARDEFVEVYLDDRWVFTASPLLAPAVCEMKPRGCVELYVERGAATFGDVRLFAIGALA